MIKEIVISNKLIAEFMGEELGIYTYTDGRGNNSKYPPYHSSWDLLMPVIEKIGLLRDVRVNLPFGYCIITIVPGRVFSVCDPTKTWLQCAWETVVQFIVVYNSERMSLIFKNK